MFADEVLTDEGQRAWGHRVGSSALPVFRLARVLWDIVIGERHRKRISGRKRGIRGMVTSLTCKWWCPRDKRPSVKSVSAKWERKRSTGEETYHVKGERKWILVAGDASAFRHELREGEEFEAFLCCAVAFPRVEMRRIRGRIRQGNGR